MVVTDDNICRRNIESLKSSMTGKLKHQMSDVSEGSGSVACQLLRRLAMAFLVLRRLPPLDLSDRRVPVVLPFMLLVLLDCHLRVSCRLFIPKNGYFKVIVNFVARVITDVVPFLNPDSSMPATLVATAVQISSFEMKTV